MPLRRHGRKETGIGLDQEDAQEIGSRGRRPGVYLIGMLLAMLKDVIAQYDVERPATGVGKKEIADLGDGDLVSGRGHGIRIQRRNGNIFLAAGIFTFVGRFFVVTAALIRTTTFTLFRLHETTAEVVQGRGTRRRRQVQQ